MVTVDGGGSGHPGTAGLRFISLPLPRHIAPFHPPSIPYNAVTVFVASHLPPIRVWHGDIGRIPSRLSRKQTHASVKKEQSWGRTTILKDCADSFQQPAQPGWTIARSMATWRVVIREATVTAVGEMTRWLRAFDICTNTDAPLSLAAPRRRGGAGRSGFRGTWASKGGSGLLWSWTGGPGP
jgi:hypothetical protein